MKQKWQQFKKTKTYAVMKDKHLFELILIALFYAFMSIIYAFSSAVSKDTHLISMSIDDKIPFIRYFIIPYYTYYFMPVIILYMVARKDGEKFKKGIISMFIVDIIANIVFLSYNVKIIRPDVVDLNMKITDVTGFDSFLDFMIAVIYRVDKNASCCFPSLHAAIGTLVAILSISFDKEKRLPLFLTILGVLSGLGCITATFFIKQHYFIDSVAGVILSLIVYSFVSLTMYLIKKKKEEKKQENNTIES